MERSSLKVDIHTHILPKNWPDLKQKYGYSGWIRMEHNCEKGKAKMFHDDGRLFRIVDENCWSLTERLNDMNRTGVHIQVLSTVPVMFSYWAKPEDTLDFSRFLNNDMAATIKSCPERFFAFGTIPLQAPELAVEEMKRCMTVLGFQGVQIGSHVNDWNLDNKALFPIYKTAEDLNCPIFVHPWDMPVQGRMEKYWLPWLVGMPSETTTAICSMIFGGVFERFPNLKVCFAHGAGMFPYTLGRIQHGFEVRPDLCATDNPVPPAAYIGKIYADSLVHSTGALKLLLDVFGENNIMLGSDYPFPLGELQPGSLIEKIEGISPNVKNKLIGDNALRFLGLENNII